MSRSCSSSGSAKEFLVKRPPWEWLLTEEERLLLDTLISESSLEGSWHSCNWCGKTFAQDHPIEHSETCPLTIARRFAQSLTAARSRAT